MSPVGNLEVLLEIGTKLVKQIKGGVVMRDSLCGDLSNLRNTELSGVIFMYLGAEGNVRVDALLPSVLRSKASP